MSQANTVNNLSSQAVKPQLQGESGSPVTVRPAFFRQMQSVGRGVPAEPSVCVGYNPPITEVSSQAHILLVDDDVSALDISTFILQQNGYAVSMASNGKDALGMLNGSVNSSIKD